MRALFLILLLTWTQPGLSQDRIPEGHDCFGVIAGAEATTDGYVYLAHNEDQRGEQMLNIYNVPAAAGRCSYLWFEFPGCATGDSFLNEWGVAVTSNRCASRETRAKGSVLYEVRTAVAQRARTAREGVRIIGEMVEKYGYNDSGRSYLIADRYEGWVCSVVRGRHWVAQRVPDDEIMTIPNYYVIGEVDLADTTRFLGSKDLVRYARRKGWYRPGRDGAFNFRRAYSDPAALESGFNRRRHAVAQELIFGNAILGDSVSFSRRPVRKIHRRDLSRLMTVEPVVNAHTKLTTIFTLNRRFPPRNGSLVWVGFPGQGAAEQQQWTFGTRSPESCHRYATADEAIEKHFTDTGRFRERWPDHFYWHYLDPSIDADVIPHDYTVYLPKQARADAQRDSSAVGDSFNDHFHVLEDPQRGMLYAFWTQGSHEAAEDEHVVFSRSADGGRSWSEPLILAGSPTLAHPRPVAAWQQPMLSRSGRLYCLWNQEGPVRKHLCGWMYGRYSDDGGQTWSEPEELPFPRRFSLDPADPAIPPTWCMWQRPLRLGQDGRYLAGCSRYGKNADGRAFSRVEFWQYDNIDEDPEIRDIRISFFNTEEEAFDATRVAVDRPFTPREAHAVEEACIVGLPDGRLFAVMRCTLGSPIWSVSSDHGQHWSRPRILRERDGGPAILQPCSPCPIYDLEGGAAYSGHYALFVHDTFDFEGLTSYQNRGPVYLRKGRFVPDADQPVWFEEPTLFSPRESGNSFYTSYTMLNETGTLWFGDCKFYLFGRRLNPQH